jgi:hypothetical protein
MKLTKTIVYRLHSEKGCGCSVSREYSDEKYTSPLSPAMFQCCPTHKEKSPDVLEVLSEMMIETLEQQAEVEGVKVAQRTAAIKEYDNTAGTMSGDNVQSLGGHNLPKNRPKRPPQVKTLVRNHEVGTGSSQQVDLMGDANGDERLTALAEQSLFTADIEDVTPEQED